MHGGCNGWKGFSSRGLLCMMAERENYGVEGIAHGRSIDDATAYRSMRCVCVCVCVCVIVSGCPGSSDLMSVFDHAGRRWLSAATPFTSDRVSYRTRIVTSTCDDRCIGSIIVRRGCLYHSLAPPLLIVQQLSLNTHLCLCFIQQSFIIAKNHHKILIRRHQFYADSVVAI